MVESSGVPIPIAAVALVALNLVEHGVDPCCSGITFVLLDEVMRGIPLACDSQFNRLQ